MSIPRIIHYGLFGRAEMTELEDRCIDTWKPILDCNIAEWTAKSGPHHSRFFLEACAARPVNASNYIRLWALHEFGGIYLDNDVEVLKPFDLSLPAFTGFWRDDSEVECVNSAVIGAEAGHPFIKRLLDRLDSMPGDSCPSLCGPGMLTEELRASGMKGVNVDQVVAGVRVFPKVVFSPWRWDEKPDRSRITDETVAIHWFGGTWS